jgi:hypothetical protein
MSDSLEIPFPWSKSLLKRWKQKHLVFQMEWELWDSLTDRV